MPRLLKTGKAFKPVKLVVVKDEPHKQVTGTITKGKYRKPPAKKKAKHISVEGPNAGPFKGKF